MNIHNKKCVHCFAVVLQVYEGVSRQGFIPPEVLADHDVILTTYATLRADFYHLGVKQGKFSDNENWTLKKLSYLIFQVQI